MEQEGRGMNAQQILESIGLTAEDVKRIADRHNIAANREPRTANRDLSGCRFVRLIRKGGAE